MKVTEVNDNEEKESDPEERELLGVKREVWQDLKDAIVPVLKKWDFPGSDAGRWDLYEALGREVAKIDWEFSRRRRRENQAKIRDEEGNRRMKAKGKPIPPRRGFYYPDITGAIVVEAANNATDRERENVEMLSNTLKLVRKIKE